MKKILYLLSGISGSGKSTWARKKLHEFEPETAAWYSRDMIRFSKLKDGEDYFAHEDYVFNLFIRAINAGIKDPFTKRIIADSTCLNDRSRDKVLRRLELNPDVEVINVVFSVPLHVCLQRNALRTGRECVPEKVIRRMYKSFSMPDNGYKTIIVNEEGVEVLRA